MMIRTSSRQAERRRYSIGRMVFRFSLILVSGSLLFCGAVHYSGAEIVVTETGTVSKDQIEEWYNAGRLAEKEGRSQDAVAFYNEVLRSDPTHRGAKRSLTAIRKNGVDIRYNKEAFLIAQAVAQSVDDPIAAAKAKMDSGDFAQAQAILQAALSRKIDDSTKKEAQQLLDTMAEARRESAARRAKLLGEQGGDNLIQLLQQAQILLEGQLVNDAEEVLRKADQLSPGNARVQELLKQAALLRSELGRKAEAVEAAADQARKSELELKARDVYLEGQSRYMEGDVIGAVKAWNRALEIDPQHTQSLQMIEATKALYENAVKREEEQLQMQAQDAEFEKKLDTVIPEYSTRDDLDVNDVLNLLKTLSGLDFVKDESVQGKVWFTVRDRTVREILDLLSTNFGYSWSRSGNTITVTSELVSKVYPLDEAQFQTLKTILEDASVLEDSSKDLRVLLYGEDGQAKTPGKKIYLNERTRSLTVTDTKNKQAVVEAFLKDLPKLAEEYTPVETRIFRLLPEEANTIRKTVESVLYGDEGSYDPSSRRKLLFDPQSNILTVIDTPDNIAKVQAILSDQEFTRSVQEGDLRAREFQVADVDDTETDPEAIARRTKHVDGIREILRAMLYGPMGQEEALLKGKRIQVDYERGTITVVDSPDNLQKVAEYLSSVRGETLQDIFIQIFEIQHVSVTDIVDALSILLYDSTTSSRNLFLDYQNIQTLDAGSQEGAQIEPQSFFEQGSRELYNLQGAGGGQDFLQFFSVKFYPDINTNRLIVYAFEQESIELVQRVITATDRPQRMVEIESRIVDVALDDLTSIGFDYSIRDPLKGDFDLDSGLSQLDFLSDGPPESSVNFTYNSLSDSQVKVLLSLIDTFDSSETLSAPRILATPNIYYPALLFIGTQQPYVDQVTLDDGGDDDPTNNRLVFDFQDSAVGIGLGFIPVILNDNHVYLEIMPNMSGIIGRVPVSLDTSGGSTGNISQSSLDALGRPIFSQQAIVSTVRIRNGDTVVLGGLINDKVEESRNEVPLLSRIPFFGSLFTDLNYTVSKKSTLIFVTVQIIEPESY